MHIEKRIARRPAVSLADDDEIPAKGEFDGRTGLGGDGRIDGDVRLTEVQLCPGGFPMLQSVQALGEGKAWIEWIKYAGEGGADDVLDQLRVDDEVV